MATYGPQEFKTRNGNRVVIRHCTASDINAYLVFQPKIASETEHTLNMVGRTSEPTQLEAAWRNSLESPIALRLGAFVGDRMVGCAWLHPESQVPHPWTRHIGRFALMILQEFWGEGLGRHMLEVIEGHAQTVGILRIEAMVRTRNERGIKLYRRMGYEIEGTRKREALIRGEYQDGFFIAKFLDSNSLWQPPRLETDRLVMRALELSDAPAIFEYASNPQVSRHTLWEPHRTIKDSESYILDYAFRYYRTRTPEPWGITLKASPDQVIGTVGLFWVSQAAKSMELAYAIGESHWGQGIVVEASRAVMDYAFREYDLARIQARCKVENTASARVMEKLGMKHEGTLRSALFHRDRHWDMRYCAVLRGEW